MTRRLALLVWLCFGSSAYAQALHGFVVGIEKYAHESQLPGAGRDAIDLTQAMRPITRILITLMDADATRDRVMAEWSRLVAGAQAGDTLLWAFSGHGMRAPESRRADRPDWLDGRLVMVGFDRRTPLGRREVIGHADLDDMFAEAGKKNLRVVFLADACHSGAVTRLIDARSSGIKLRYVPSYDADADLDTPASVGQSKTSGASDAPPERPDHVTFLAAALPTETVPEVPIDGPTRGVVSWSLARALEGTKAADSEGRVTRGALAQFILQSARNYAEGRQHPTVRPADRADEVLFRVPVRTQSAAAPLTTKIRMRVLGLDPEAEARLIGSLDGASALKAEESPDLTWDSKSGDVLNGAGEPVAFSVARAALQAVVDKLIALQRIKALGLGAALDTSLTPGDGVHPEGSSLVWRASGLRYPNFILFSLASDGMVQFHYPAPGDPERIDPSQPQVLEFAARPPYGADHLVVMTSDRPPSADILELRQLDGQRKALEAARLVQRIAARGGYQIAIQPLFTGPPTSAAK